MARSVAEIKKRMAGTKTEKSEKRTFRPGYERVDDIKRRVNADAYHQRQSERINSILQGAQSYFGSFQEKLDGMTWENASQVNDQVTADVSRLLSESEEVRWYLSTYGDRLGEDTVTSLTESLDALESARVQAQKLSDTKKSFLTEYDTAEEASAAWDTAVTDAENREKYGGLTYEQLMDKLYVMPKDAADYAWLEAYAPTVMTGEDYDKAISEKDTEISDAEKALEEYDRLILGQSTQNPNAYANTRLQEIRSKYGSKADLKQQIELLKSQRAQLGQEYERKGLTSVGIEDSSFYAPDFSEYARFNPNVGVDSTYEYINGDAETRNRVLRELTGLYGDDEGASAAGIETDKKYLAYDRMKAEEIATYNYHYNKNGREAAERYLSYLREDLNARRAEDVSAFLKGKTGLELAYSGIVGLDQFNSGMQGFIRSAIGDDSYVAPSTTQIAGSMVREDLGDVDLKWYDFSEDSWKDADISGSSLGQSVYDAGSTIANMTPSILASTAVGLMNPAAGKIAAGALLGMSAAGNGYQEKINAGYSEEDARAYGYMVGASEALLESVLGGISKLGGGVLKDASLKALGKLDNVLAKVAKSAGGQLLAAAGSEAFEEGLQSIIEPYLWQAVSGEEAQVNWEETLYSALLGFTTGGLFEGTEQIGTNWKKNTEYKNTGSVVMDSEGAVERLTALANELDGISSYKLGKQAQAVTQKATKKNVGRLFSDISRTITEQNSKELSARLAEKGIDAGRASQIAEAVLTERTGSYGLTQEQTKLLRSVESDSRVAEAVREILDTEGSAAYQRNAQLEAIQADVMESALTQLAREKVDAEMGIDASAEDVSEEIPSTEGKILRGNEIVEIADVESAGGGKLIVKLTDGSTADVKDLDFPDTGEQELWRVVGQYAEDAESARALLDEYRAGDLDAFKYARGVEEGFLYGTLNISPKEMEMSGTYVNMLNPMQRNMAYKQGIIAGQRKTQQRQEIASERNAGKTRKGGVHYGYDGGKVDRSKLTKAQRVGVDFAERLAQKKGMTFYFYRSYRNAEGERVFKNAKGEIVPAKENGWYDPSDGSIHIDLNCGDMGSTVLYTIAHELTHFIQDWSPVKYRILCGILTEGFLERGQSVRRLVLNKQAEYREMNVELSYEEAFNEVMASSMEGVLNDGRVMDLLDAAETKDMSLAEQIMTFLHDVAILIGDTIQTYMGVVPESPEGRMVMRMEDIRKQIQDVFAEGLHEAGENYRQGGKINTAPEGGVQYSYIGDTKDGRRCYQSGFDSSVGMDERVRLFKERIATIFNLGAVELKTDVKKIRILGDRFTSQKNIFGDAKADGSEYMAKINSLYDLADILATSTYDPNATGKEPSYENPSSKPKNAAHRDVKYWYKFRNEIVFDGVPYTVTFSIRDKGSEQYQYFIDFKENKTPGISNTAVKKPPASKPSVLHKQYTQSGSKSQPKSLRYQKNEAAQAHLEEQNASMGEDVEGLNQLVAAQRQRGREGQIRHGALDAAASHLLKLAGAKGDKAELMKLLHSFYGYVANGTDLTWDSLRKEAMPVVRWLMKHVVRSKQQSEYAKDVLSTLRSSRIYLDDVQKGEVTYQYGSFGAYRNMLMGSITFANEGSMSLDSKWHELSEMYPDIFDPDTNAADMPEALADIISRLRNDDTSELEYEYNREFIEQDLINRVYDSYWNASTLYSLADHYEKLIKTLKGKHKQRMNAVYQRHRAAEINQQTVYQQRLEAARAHYEEQYQRREVEFRESRLRAVERHNQTEMRQKIKRVVRDLWKLQEKAPKDRRTKEELREFVDRALWVADLVWLERYDEYDMVRNGVGVDLRGDEPQLLQECRELLERHLEVSDADLDTRWDIDAALQQAKDKAALDKELAKRMKILREAGVFAAEFQRLHEVDAGQLVDDLLASYERLKETKSPYLKEAYQEVLTQRLRELRENIGAKSIRNMTLQELEQLYEAYSAVLHVVRSANKTFFENRAADVHTMGTGVVQELEGFKRQKFSRMVIETMRKTAWNNLTPAYVFRKLGSKTLEKLYKNLVSGMGIYGKDIAEAKLHWQAQAKKYGAHSWDMTKRMTFVDKTGNEFSLSLGQVMSLYALSKRKQAQGHLEVGGIMLDNAEAYIENIVDQVLPKVITDAGTYKLDKTVIEGICSKLTAEQKAFVDATQEYLSSVMSEKGNEVSMKLYGIKLFKEKHYFPLRTASQTRYESTELIDQNKLKNSGFTRETKPDASNAVVLSDYSHVWTGHVKQMSLYHGMTLAMEDMDRVLNFGKTFERDENGNIKRDKDGNPVAETALDSVTVTLQNIWGAHPENYIRELMKQLNGGVRTDSAEEAPGKMLGRFKKAQVAASLSVWIQQWTSIFRAMAHVDFWHFIHKPKLGKARDEAVAEMKKYCPIAIIKEMGGFDTGLGNSEHDYITMAEPRGVKENWEELKKHPLKRIDEATGWLPARADENTWMRIWLAVKKETHKKHPNLKGNTDAFFEAASARFTEVINLTQVYDSVLSKSALMRSKGSMMKMVTQFMAEPTMVLNMAVDAMTQTARTGKVQWQTMFAMTASVLMNAMCSSVIYAMRDDDEEETFTEKYMAQLAGNLIDGFNPLTYMPIIRDIWSIFQGYDVGRSDVALWSDLENALKKVVKLYQNEDATDKEISDAWWEVSDCLFNVTGLPVRNIRREVNAVKNLFMTLEQDRTVRDTTKQSLGDAIQEANQSSIPILAWLKGETKAKKLLDACIAGDEHYAGRLRGTYKTEAAANNAIVREVKERFEDGKLGEAKAIRYLTAYAGKTGEEAQAYITKWQFAMEHPDSGLDPSRVPKYIEYAEPAGISVELYVEYCEKKSVYSKREDILPVIDKLPLTRKQKDALYYAEGYAESKLDEAPWN